MEILSGLNDNQSALAMCGMALLGCGLIMSLSYFIGAGKASESAERLEVPRQPVADETSETRRKAA